MSPRSTLPGTGLDPLGVRAAYRLKEILSQGARPARPLPAPPPPPPPPLDTSSDEPGRPSRLRLRRAEEDDDEGAGRVS